MDERRPEASDGDGGFGFRPLYRQVRDMLIRRLVDGVWAPGDPLPSEMQLAAELRVSQGTVRKALDAMAAENLVVRQQGRGTFVSRHDDERIMFQFFKLVPDEGDRAFPLSCILSVARADPSDEEREGLSLEPADEVVRMRRSRSVAGHPAIVETIAVPARLFPEIELMELPNNLYGLYTLHFGITISHSQERLKAVAASPEDAELLGLRPGAPALQIARVAFSLDRTPVEWRRSVCSTEHVHYRSELR